MFKISFEQNRNEKEVVVVIISLSLNPLTWRIC